MKNKSISHSIAATIMTAAFATSGLAAPPKDSPPDDWEILLSNVEVIVENTDTIETDISGLQTSIDGVQASVDGGVASLTVDVAGVKTDVAGVQISVDGGVASLTADVAGVKADVAGVKTDVAGVQTSVDGGVASLTVDVAGVQDSVNDLAVSLDALESVISGLVADGPLTEHVNGAETVYSTAPSNTFDYWTYGDYADPRHVSLTLQARGMDGSDFVEVWVRTHPNDSTDSDRNIRYAYEASEFGGPSWVEQIEFDAIEWGVRVHKNDQYDDYPTTAINLTWAATVSALDSQNGAQTVYSTADSNTFVNWTYGDYADPRHVSLTLQARGMDGSDFVEVWVRTHPNDSTDSDRNIRYAYEASEFGGPSWVEQIEFDAIEWGVRVHKNDQYDDYPTTAINLTWAATTE